METSFTLPHHYNFLRKSLHQELTDSRELACRILDQACHHFVCQIELGHWPIQFNRLGRFSALFGKSRRKITLP